MSNKRKQNIINDNTKTDIINELKQIKLNLKGFKLVKYLNKINNVFKTCKLIYNNNKLTTIINILNNTIKMAIKENNKTFVELLTLNPNKKVKRDTKAIIITIDDNRNNFVDDDDDDDDDNYNDDDDDDNDDDDDDDDDDSQNKKKSQAFLDQIFKTRGGDNESVIVNYFSKLSDQEKLNALTNIKEINNYQVDDKPILFKIMELPLPISQKNHILKTYTELASSRTPENKLKSWFDSLMTIPFGQFKGINLKSIKTKKVKIFLDNLKNIMDDAVYGHDEAKRQIIQIMGQQIRNPDSKGNVLGIYGPAGVGKTELIKNGIAKAMDKPFVFISLGGATDSSFLEGHSYTYEGSIYGRIVNGLITSKCMDPIIYFDELDKVSKTHKGDEIINILIHLTDPVQNSHFRDKYFHGIDIDLSRATIIFSFNDISNVNPILLDRITTVETKYLMISQKVHIAQNYLLPTMMQEMGLNYGDINIDDELIKHLITTYTNEGGVRKLKALLYNVSRELNLANLIKIPIAEDTIEFPFNLKMEHLQVLLKNKHQIEQEKIHDDDQIGIINGLYATSDGSYGGIMPIQTLWIPTTTPFEIKATGNLQQVIKESTQVASTLAFNCLSKEQQNKTLKELKRLSKGIHIHCPDGAVPKDGPSAGTALTVAIYSMLTNRKIRHDIAITGEITLQGKVTAIGGLDNKLEGAKRAGVKLVLYPKENQKTLDKIKERNPVLFKNFDVQPIETINEAINYSLV
jgi:endopeptidase La